MIYQWKWLRPRAGSDTGAVMIFQMSMYYLSFAPLWILVFLTDIFSICDNDKYLVTEYISIVLILFFMVIAVRRMRNKLNSKNSDNVKCICLEEVQEEKFLVAEFLMSFIFPMFAFDFTNHQGAVLFLVFFIIFDWLCIKHNYFCVNVVLEVMGYKIYNCKYKNEDNELVEKKILSKKYLKKNVGEKIRVRYLNNEYVLDCTEVLKEELN